MKVSSPYDTPGRNPNLDWVKVIAMFMVIGIHSFDEAYVPYDKEWPIYISYQVVLSAVPLFFMVSGYLTLGRPVEACGYRYALRKVWGIVRFMLIIAAAYFLIYNGVGFAKQLVAGEPLHFIREPLHTIYEFINPSPGVGQWPHFWYLQALIVIFLVLPPLNRLYHRSDKAFVWVFVAMVGICVLYLAANIIWPPVMDLWHGILTLPMIPWVWIAYFMMGALIKRYHIRVSRAGLWLLGALVAMLAMRYLLWTLTGSVRTELFDCDLTTMLFTAFFFISIMQLKIKPGAAIRTLSPLFLMVYTIHLGVGHHVKLYLDSIGIADYEISDLVKWGADAVASISLAWLLMRIPYVAKLFRI